MIQKKFKSVLISGVASLSLLAGLLFPAVNVEAEDTEESGEFNMEWTTPYTQEYTFQPYGESSSDSDDSGTADDSSSTADDSSGTTEDSGETSSSTGSSSNDAVEDTIEGETAPLGQLVAYWPFDGNYNETVSNMTTELGAKKLTYTDGVFGKAAVFNGKDTYLYVKDSILNLGNSWDDNNDKFTISAWVNLGDSVDDDKYLIDKGKSVGYDKNDNRYWTDPYQIYFANSEPIALLSNDFEDTNKDPAYRTEGSSRTGGKYVEGQEWFLLTVTYDGSRVKIYHDNELLTQSNYTDGITFNNDEMYIGVDGKLEYFFSGAVDDLRIYTKTLSYDEVNELYEKGLKANKELVEPTKQLVAYYPFDDSLKDLSTFKNNAEKVAVGGTTKYIIGKNGKAITMSKGNYIRVPAGDQLNVETQFTVSFWLKLGADGEFPILYRQNPSYTDDNDNDWTYRSYISGWDKGAMTSISMNTRVYDPDNWVPEEGQGMQTNLTYEDNKIKGTNWVHYTYTYQDGQMKCYINGTLLNKSDKSDLINIENASGDLLIGYDGDTFINGAIDELKIYSKCLSATEVEKEAKRIDSISLSSADVKSLSALSKGDTLQLSAIVLKDGDTGKTSQIKTNDADVTYATSNKNIFTIKDGKITAVRAGKAKLTITYGAHSVSYNVVIK